MITLCPHCKNKVLIKSENICPSCKKDVNYYSSQQLLKTKISLKETQVFPDICFNCGDESDKIIKLRYKKQQKKSKLINPLVFLSPIGSIIEFLFDIIMRSTGSMVFKLPVCKKCYKTAKDLKQYYMNFETRKIDVVVHKNFLRKLKR